MAMHDVNMRRLALLIDEGVLSSTLAARLMRRVEDPDVMRLLRTFRDGYTGNRRVAFRAGARAVLGSDNWIPSDEEN